MRFRKHRAADDVVMLALDAKGDGALSTEEIANATASLRALDVNGDGQLTIDEFGPPPPEGAPRAPELTDRGHPGWTPRGGRAFTPTGKQNFAFASPSLKRARSGTVNTLRALVRGVPVHRGSRG